MEVSPDTGNVKILKYVAVHDIGQPIHLAAVEGQIEGATAMSIGQALCEQVVFDQNGKTMNPSFVDYLMPTINMRRLLVLSWSQVEVAPLTLSICHRRSLD